MEQNIKITEVKKKIRRVWRFLADDIWDIELSSLPSIRRAAVKAVRVIQLVFRGFKEDQCPLHASALTFNTLMSIVPVLAVSLALARGFGAADKAEEWVKSKVSGWTAQLSTPPEQAEPSSPAQTDGNKAASTEDVAMQREQLGERINGLVDQLFGYVNNIKFGALGGVGLGFLLLTVVLVLGRVEASFNKVWGVTSSRPFFRKLFDYLGILIIMPMLVVAATSLPIVEIVLRSPLVPDTIAESIRTSLGGGFLKGVMVILMSTLAFGFLLMFVPNTKVRVGPGLAGGLVAAILFVVWLWLCAKAQVGVVKNLKIYASFAVVPIVLFWVFISWEIVLFSAEVAFALQNCTTYQMETRAHSASVRSRLSVVLSVLKEAASAMSADGDHMLDVKAYAVEHRVPIRLMNSVVDELVRIGLLGKLSSHAYEGAKDRPDRFVLMKSPEAVKVQDVIDLILSSGAAPSELGLHNLSTDVEEALAMATKGMEDGLDELTLKSLAAS